MARFQRVWVVFRKDLIDALRDRRTLVAMVIVPVVLYPLLMVVVVQALKLEKERLERQHYRIGVPDADHERWLRGLLDEEIAAAASASAPAGVPHGGFRARLDPDQYEIVVSPERPERLILESRLHVVLRLDPPPSHDEAIPPNRRVMLFYDAAEVASNVAQENLADLIDECSRRIIDERLADHGLEHDVLLPLEIRPLSLASPAKLGGSLLGQIMPFLLVIITVTGAIYPAIDLTAGERERGTLETLMAAPAPIMQIVAGKFLVIATITLAITTLNLASIFLTVRYGGLAEAIAQRLGEQADVTALSFRVLPIVLLTMVPFVVFFSAIMLAVCSFARSFKEAQNYMMPVVIVAILPAMIVSYMPTLSLTGMLAVTPVANIVALIRELFLGKYDVSGIVLVLGSTCLYAAAAVLGAARLYGQEAVLFTDVGSYKALFHRRLIRPKPLPPASVALLSLALLFPVQFYWQSALVTEQTSAAGFRWVILGSQVLFFAAPALLVTWFVRANWRMTLSLNRPAPKAVLGALLIAAGIVPLACLITRIQVAVGALSTDNPAMQELQQRLIGDGNIVLMVLVFGIAPAICEELMFRGVLLAGLRDVLRPLALCVTVGLLFGLFHMMVEKLLLTTLLGALLAYVCWRSGSILLSMFVHGVNNTLLLLCTRYESLAAFFGADASGRLESPAWVAPVGVACVAAGLMLLRRSASRGTGL